MAEGSASWGLTTTFTEPSGCVSGISRYPDATLGLWHNIINPVPTLTLTSCYPPPFLASASATVGKPPFAQLICPHKWETYNYNQTYIVCCPSAYGLYAPSWTVNTQRPAEGGWCTSSVDPGIYVDMTIYDKAGQTSLTGTTVDDSTFLLVQATAFDGIAATAMPTSTAPSSKTSSSSTDSATKARTASSTTTGSNTVTTSSSSPSTDKATSSSTTSKASTTKWTGPAVLWSTWAWNHALALSLAATAATLL